MTDSGQVRHEPTKDVNVRAIVLLGLSLMGIIILSGLIAFGLFTAFGGRLAGDSVRPQASVSEKHPIASHPLLLRKERLHSYGWVNKEKRIIHIPIDFAMKWLAIRKKISQVKRPSRQNSAKR